MHCVCIFGLSVYVILCIDVGILSRDGIGAISLAGMNVEGGSGEKGMKVGISSSAQRISDEGFFVVVNIIRAVKCNKSGENMTYVVYYIRTQTKGSLGAGMLAENFEQGLYRRERLP